MANSTAKTQPRITDLLDPAFMARLDALDLLSRKILQGKLQGQRRSKRRGQSVEFADHRPYVAGDDLRFVDWNIYGRLEQLFLKLFMEEQDLTVHIVMDVSASMDPPTSPSSPLFAGKTKDQQADKNPNHSKALFVKKLTAALGYVSLVNNNRVTISSFSSGVQRQLPNMRGRNYLAQMAEFLVTEKFERPTNFDQTCRQLAAGRIGNGIMIILSDFFFKEGYDSGLRRLISPKYDIYAIQILSPDELNPQLTGDLQLLDVEDDDTAEITASSTLLKYYQKNLAAYCNELKDFCTRRGATYVLANSAEPVETLVLNYLRRIRLLH